MVKIGDDFGWNTLVGEPHYGRVTAIDSNVIYVVCQYHGRECSTEARSDELRDDT